MPEGSFEMQNNFLSVMVIETPFIVFYSPTLTPFSSVRPFYWDDYFFSYGSSLHNLSSK
jgi:hypothetical protein